MHCVVKFTIFFAVFVVFFMVGLPLILVLTYHVPKKPNFSVESTTVKAYNLTSDNRLFCIINIGLKAENPYPKKTTFDLAGIDMEVRKGKHHKLADDALPEFDVGPGSDTVVVAEAVGLRVGLKKKIAREIRGDVAAGEGRVNIYMTGFVSSDHLRVTCKNVVVDFSKSTVMVQKVKCKVTVTEQSNSNGDTMATPIGGTPTNY